jgi:Zn finger protein HypA/HybF involved in hydrogenase expression
MVNATSAGKLTRKSLQKQLMTINNMQNTIKAGDMFRAMGVKVTNITSEGIEQDCMRCEQTYHANEIQDLCPQCTKNPNRIDI